MTKGMDLEKRERVCRSDVSYENYNVYFVFVDLREAYDRVDGEVMWDMM